MSLSGRENGHVGLRLAEIILPAATQENLEDLTKLRDHIQKSKNMVILLTPGIFERPWCLVEMVSVPWPVCIIRVRSPSTSDDCAELGMHQL